MQGLDEDVIEQYYLNIKAKHEEALAKEAEDATKKTGSKKTSFVIEKAAPIAQASPAFLAPTRR